MQVGDRVKINIEAVQHYGLESTDSQKEAYDYILDHPDEIYSITCVNGLCLAPIIVSHEILGKTSFFIDELIKVGDSE